MNTTYSKLYVLRHDSWEILKRTDDESEVIARLETETLTDLLMSALTKQEGPFVVEREYAVSEIPEKYRVRYEIDIDADDPVQAANEAYRIMVSPDSLPPFLEVFGRDGSITEVDLEDE